MIFIINKKNVLTLQCSSKNNKKNGNNNKVHKRGNSANG